VNGGVDSKQDPRLLSSWEFVTELVLLACCSWQLSIHKLCLVTSSLVGRVQV